MASFLERGFLERVFQDYDYIRTQRPSRMEHIAPASTPASFKPKPDDTPPWVEPPKAEKPPMEEKPPTVADVASQDNAGFCEAHGWSVGDQRPSEPSCASREL